MRKFGLIGKNISYSFSKTYFNNKFENECIKNVSYQNFDLDSIKDFNSIFIKNPDISGLNVTIPYKESIIKYLDELNKTAKNIGAVNTIRITKKGKLKGYNTDYYGFKKSLKPLLSKHHKRALILGTGGASKAIAYALKKLKISYTHVSRSKTSVNFTYTELDDSIVKDHLVIINCSPLGTYPNINECPNIPYEALTNKHILYDLIYNPEETRFLDFGKRKGCITSNGLKMLELQAEKSWEIWNK
ncbi:MAG: shikimate dehydrogenase [Bacteroidia bacterium]|nr:shikimate dehydrogenase [Bacteroidia bacterium]